MGKSERPTRSRHGDLLANLGQVSDAEWRAKLLHQIHHWNAVKGQLISPQLELLLRPIETLVNQIKILDFHCKDVKIQQTDELGPPWIPACPVVELRAFAQKLDEPHGGVPASREAIPRGQNRVRVS